MKSCLFLLVSMLVACGAPQRRDDSSGGGGSSGGNCPAAADCGSRTCGVDPVCGVSCGTCEAGFSCSSAGICQAPAPPPGCVSTTHCVADSDCPNGSRCNRGLSPPTCQELYCGPKGTACDQSYFCADGASCLESVCGGPPTSTDSLGTVGGEAVTVQSQQLMDLPSTDDVFVFYFATNDRCTTGDKAEVAILIPRPTSDSVRYVFQSASDSVPQIIYEPTPDTAVHATSGEIDITAIPDNGGVLRGTFTATFPGGTLAGSIDATACPQ